MTTTPLEEWVVPIVAGAAPVGVGRLGIENGKASATGGSDDTVLGRALLAAPDGIVIEDPTIDAWYVVVGDSVHALNGRAFDDLGGSAVSLAQAQRIVTARYTAAAEAASGVPDAVGGGSAARQAVADEQSARPATLWLGVGAIALVGVGLLARLVVARRRLRSG